VRKALVAAAGLVLLVALTATQLGYGVDRERYVAANEAILDELPAYPGARRTSTRSSPYYEEDAAWSPVAGYTTLVFFELASDAEPEGVAAFYERELRRGGWRLVGKLTEPPYAAGPILSFRRGGAALSVNLESWRRGIVEIAVDHARGP
jgi:hypothetical protein